MSYILYWDILSRNLKKHLPKSSVVICLFEHERELSTQKIGAPLTGWRWTGPKRWMRSPTAWCLHSSSDCRRSEVPVAWLESMACHAMNAMNLKLANCVLDLKLACFLQVDADAALKACCWRFFWHNFASNCWLWTLNMLFLLFLGWLTHVLYVFASISLGLSFFLGLVAPTCQRSRCIRVTCRSLWSPGRAKPLRREPTSRTELARFRR